MDPFTIGIIGIILIIVLLALGVHIALALGAVGMFGCIAILGFEAAMWQSTSIVYNIVAAQAFIVLPLFIFMGLFAGVGGLSKDIQQILLDVGKESELYVANYLKERRLEVLAKMKAKGLEIIVFPKEEIVKWAKVIPDTPAVWAAEAAEAGQPGWEIAQRWQEITTEMGYEWPRQWAVKK